MGFFDGIEKLITEHGSAAILKERLLLIADKYAALEKTLVVCEAKAKEIISEKQAFQLENLKLKEKVRGLEEQLTERHGARLEQVKERILQLLANSPPRITAQQVAAALNIDAQISMYHLTEMEKNRLINDSHRMGGSTPGWSIAQDGRGYLIRHGLLV